MQIKNSVLADQAPKQDLKKVKQSLKAYGRYAGIGFQMIAIIGLFTFIGFQIDKKRASGQPLFTAIFSLLGVCLALYQVIRSLTKNKS